MSLQQMRERANRVRSIPLCSVLLAVGAEQDREDKARWHTRRGVISVTGMKFMNWNRAIGGGGAIDLIIHLNGLDFQSAVAWLRDHFPRSDYAAPPPGAPKADPQLPVSEPSRLSSVDRYLIVERRIRPDRIKRLIQSGHLYADRHANAVFVLRSAENAPVGAELRGSGPRPWRGMAPGSRKDLGYFSVRESRVDGIILCEAAIDAISCSLIHPRHWCISTAGARPAPAWLPAIISHGLPPSAATGTRLERDAPSTRVAQPGRHHHPLLYLELRELLGKRKELPLPLPVSGSLYVSTSGSVQVSAIALTLFSRPPGGPGQPRPARRTLLAVLDPSSLSLLPSPP